MRSRRLAILTTIPLGVIALGLFVPPIVRSRGRFVDSPFLDGVSMMWWIHGAAAGLALLTAAWAIRRRPPRPWSFVVALALIAAAAYPQIAFARFAISDHWTPGILGIAGVFAGTVGFVALAWQRRDWQRQLALVGAYAFVALPYGCPVLMGMFNVWGGGVTFLVAEATLLALVLRGTLSRGER
ncbi:MAG TPA: hypothetical protein VFQ53_20315 [Kofleriaceae bacterium]|nr:hypothetical protein [Kofleriaceae bacterium]